MPTAKTVRTLGLALALAALCACRGTMQPMSFYTLTPLAPPAAARPATGIAGPSVGVGPLDIPLALDRPQIVTRAGANELALAEFHRWGGSLSGDILRAVTQDLSTLLGSDRVVAHPWTRFIAPDFRVPLDIQRFDGALGREVTLEATWAVHCKDEPSARVVRRSVLIEPAPGPGYPDLVAAHGRALAALSREIAAELERQMAGSR